jgi:hypothetical protein
MEKNRFKQLLESKSGNVKPLINEEVNWKNFIIRRFDALEKTIDQEFDFTGGVCYFKKENDFDGYYNHFINSVAKSLLIRNVEAKGITPENAKEIVKVTREIVKDDYKEKIKKHYKSTKCKS